MDAFDYEKSCFNQHEMKGESHSLYSLLIADLSKMGLTKKIIIIKMNMHNVTNNAKSYIGRVKIIVYPSTHSSCWDKGCLIGFRCVTYFLLLFLLCLMQYSVLLYRVARKYDGI